jgi:hypothetical protein
VLHRSRDRGHGRVETRSLKVVTVARLGFPHARQALQITRRVRDLHSRRWRTVVVYAVTDLTFTQASPRSWPTCSVGTGRSRTPCTGSAT